MDDLVIPIHVYLVYLVNNPIIKALLICFRVYEPLLHLVPLHPGVSPRSSTPTVLFVCALEGGFQAPSRHCWLRGMTNNPRMPSLVQKTLAHTLFRVA